MDQDSRNSRVGCFRIGAAVDLANASAVRLEYAAWRSARRHRRARFSEWVEYHWCDCAACCDSGNGFVAGDKLLVRSSLRNRRKRYDYEVRICGQDPGTC